MFDINSELGILAQKRVVAAMLEAAIDLDRCLSASLIENYPVPAGFGLKEAAIKLLLCEIAMELRHPHLVVRSGDQRKMA